MARRIVLVQGHPDAANRHLVTPWKMLIAKVRWLAVMNSGAWTWQGSTSRCCAARRNGSAQILPAGLHEAHAAIEWANHLVLIFPLWLGDMPALLKGFLEQIMRPGIAFSAEGGNPFAHKRLQGRSARIVCTMGMPAAIYRLYFRAHSIRSLERNILGFVGIAPVDETLIGMVGKFDEKSGRRWLAKMRKLGQSGA